MAYYRYRVYGLYLESELACPGFVTVSEAKPDVFVKMGDVPDELENVKASGFKFQANPDHVLTKGRRAKMLVSKGIQVTIQPKEGTHKDVIRSLFMAWGLGALLHQRNVFPLHGSVISLGNACVAFCAPSGTGKSSLAALLVKRGYTLLDDNIAAIRFIDGAYMVYPGTSVIKFPLDVLKKSGDSFARLGTFQSFLDKSVVVMRQDFPVYPQPLRKVYVLTRSGQPGFALSPLSGDSRFDSLMKNTFCPQFLRGMNKYSQHFRTVRSLANQLPMVGVQLPDWPTPYADVADVLEQDFLA